MTGRIAQGAAFMLMGLASIASFHFGRPLAELAGMSPPLAGLWPIIVAATVFQAALFYVVLGGASGRGGRTRFYFAAQVVAAVAAAIAGNTAAAATQLQQIPEPVAAAVISVPTVCLLICVGNTLVFLRARRQPHPRPARTTG